MPKKEKFFLKKGAEKKFFCRIHLISDSQSAKSDSKCLKKLANHSCQSDSQLPHVIRIRQCDSAYFQPFMYVCGYVCMYMYLCMCVHLYVCMCNMYLCMCVCTYVGMHVYIYVYM